MSYGRTRAPMGRWTSSWGSRPVGISDKAQASRPRGPITMRSQQTCEQHKLRTHGTVWNVDFRCVFVTGGNTLICRLFFLSEDSDIRVEENPLDVLVHLVIFLLCFSFSPGQAIWGEDSSESTYRSGHPKDMKSLLDDWSFRRQGVYNTSIPIFGLVSVHEVSKTYKKMLKTLIS